MSHFVIVFLILATNIIWRYLHSARFHHSLIPILILLKPKRHFNKGSKTAHIETYRFKQWKYDQDKKLLLKWSIAFVNVNTCF